MTRKMKDSGIEWIGEIPESWEVTRLKALFAFGKGLPITKEKLVENGVPVISYGQIHSRSNSGVKVQEELIRYVPESYLESGSNSLVHQNDFIFADTSEDLDGCGNCVFVDREIQLFAGYHTIIFRSKNGLDNKYLAYLFKTDEWRSQIRSRVSGVKLFSISRKILSDSTVILPPESDQKRIASYLDTQCAKIDAVLEQTRQSIEEYKRLKQAVITRAVTKGIRPGRKMKDSGIEWIGEVPEEWEVFRIANLYDERNEKGTDDLPILTVSINTGISDHEIPDSEKPRAFVRSEDRTLYKRVCPGDLAYNMMRAWQGAFGAVRVEGMVSPAYVVAKPKNPGMLDSRYIEALLRTPSAIEEMHRYSRGITDFRLRLYWPEFKSICVCVPPFEEQICIAEYIDEKSAEIDTLIQKKTLFLHELESYKKCLIYECVTGKREVKQAQRIVSVDFLDLRVLLMCRMIELMNPKGRVHLQKGMCCADYLLDLNNQTEYTRHKMGPYDTRIEEYELKAVQQGWIVVKSGSPVKYIKTRSFEEYRVAYNRYFGNVDDKIQEICLFIGKMNTSEAGRVATLLAAWNDFLLDGISPTDTQIVNEVRTNWTPNKANSQESTWLGTLNKMKKNRFIPMGYGKHTVHLRD